ncbi:hypothetical protein KVH30_02255 [Streptomyces olivaceus]|uniref:DUF6221 family protein n=1 Tax=Streptomyces olivaceus TaxID=47716 RepID=UPI001CCBD323|nr:DUF6221 family protein [Streptomyces olivaceus]MBZ6290395.1 hypothetical protein [Streptomyces olivaceus]MBZ6324347.1 hypothetical protein [Streptomyces olivaceus]
MDDLVQWLRAQLDGDERTARAADGELSAVFTRIGSFDPEMAADERHIMTHQPARVLREIDAKRRTLERHTPHSSGTADCSVHCERAHPGVQVCNHDGRRWPCPDALDLTAGYADRPGYRETWRP